MKKFLVIGSINAVAWNGIFPLVKFNKMDIGYVFNKFISFTIPGSDEYIKLNFVGWYQSLKNNIERPKIELSKYYNPVDYPKYDNYDAIEVSLCRNIPMDYTGLMGVPITFIKYINYQQFEIVGKIAPILNGKKLYVRLIIKNKHPVSIENNVNNKVDE